MLIDCKKYSLLILCMFLLLLAGCKRKIEKTSATRNLAGFAHTEFVLTLEHTISKDKNSIYAASFLYSWDKVRALIGSPLEVQSGLDDLHKLNASRSYMATLTDDDYTTTATVTDNSIDVKAEFQKTLPFEINFISYKDHLKFESQTVESFGFDGFEFKRHFMMDILYYQDDNRFVIRLNSKDNDQEILLYKSTKSYPTLIASYNDMQQMIAMGKLLNGDNNNWRYTFRKEDELVIPKLEFDIETNYKKLERNEFRAHGRTYQIKKASQRTAFVMNESGAKIESESESFVTCSKEKEVEDMPHPKHLAFDQPFLLVLKRKDARYPYFAVRVANTELMRAVD